jgi:hypothetical protein
LTTYWLVINSVRRRNSSISNMSGQSNRAAQAQAAIKEAAGQLSDKHERLVNWITNELANLLKEIMIQRMGIRTAPNDADGTEILELETTSVALREGKHARMPLDEVEEIITLPKFETSSKNLKFLSRETFELRGTVLSELHVYIHTIATMYPNNPFHNFEHASHVTMSVVKLLSRIVAPNINFDGQDVAATLHDHTYGITSDPLTQFAVVLSALFHDVDHPGVSNSQLIKEKTPLAQFYKSKSVAEQNSVDLAWTLLMDAEFSNLRGAIYRTNAEFKRFRQLIVNTVMATDIMDKDLGAARKVRWNKAFSDEAGDDKATDVVNRKATVAIEHIIQASDIAHTMQHWHIYRKWNGRLFEEMYKVSSYIH